MGNRLKKNVPVLRFPEFKDTWEDKILGEVSNVQTGPFGSQLKNEQYITGGTPVVTVEHIKDFWINSFDYPSVTDEDRKRLKKYSLKSGDLVFSRVGSVDLSACVEDYQEGWLFSSRMLRVRPNELLKPKFLAYFLQQTKVRRYIVRISVGSTMPSLNTEILQSLPIKYCSIAEQEKIAGFLGAVDTRISQLRRKHELLQTYKRGVMQKIFSQQIRFKCDDGQPFHNWEKKTLGDIAINGFSNGVFNDPSKVGWGYRLINVKDIYTSRSINVDSLTRLNLEEEEFRKNQAEYGDIFFTRSSLVKEGIAHSNILLSQDQDITYDGHLIRFRFNHEFYLPQFLGLALKSAKVRQQLVARGKTGTMTTIGQEDIASVQALIPCRQEQEKIADFLTVIDQKIEAVAKQIELTEQFKKGLLQKMFV